MDNLIDVGMVFLKFQINLFSEQLRTNPLSASPIKWSNTRTIRRLLPTNCMSVFDYFVVLTFKLLIYLGNFFITIRWIVLNTIQYNGKCVTNRCWVT